MKSIFFPMILFVFLFSCEGKKQKIVVETPKPDEDYLVTVNTSEGEMKLVLFDQTPNHKNNFLKLVANEFYHDLLFHRVINNFMIQGGDPKSKDADLETDLGNGDPGYTVPAEIRKGLFHYKGMLGAARKMDQENPKKASNGSQFYIVHGRTYNEEELGKMRVNYQKLYELFGELVKKPEYKNVASIYLKLQQEKNEKEMETLIYGTRDFIKKEFNEDVNLPLSAQEIENYGKIGGAPMLDGEYTIFGQVISGLEVIDKITSKAVNSKDRPTENVDMKMTLTLMKRTEITAKYGYKYP